MSLSDVASMVEIGGGVAIVVGIIFGVIQPWQHREQTRNLAIAKLAALVS